MKIGILGTRGIPNYYGGFEQFAQFLSKGLVERGHKVMVYCSSLHPYKESTWEQVELIHCRDFEHKIGTAGQFIYDLNCILDSRSRQFDIILQLGYTSSSIWAKLLPKQSIVLTNMDGLEWKRTKFSKAVQKFLQLAEKWAVHTSDNLIADSIGIKDYLQKKYNVDSYYIPYGAEVFNKPNKGCLGTYEVEKDSYYLLIARLEPENNIEVILDGYVSSNSNKPFLVIGKTDTPFAKHLLEKYRDRSKIRFLGGVYNQEDLNNLRYFSNLYFHGHSVGGTNPSLLEAMASNAFIVAHDNVFNRSILEEDALFFSSYQDVCDVICSEHLNMEAAISNNLRKIEGQFSWDMIIEKYEDLMTKSIS